ncbi:uncharacterized protein LOC134215066 [Armigeres subalbatus]|uniref:uncharacterized protein LOC134215066 n=1 Tax=Armigeres subalbatus TaxID=124917 RepID=UPI002ED64542
MEKRDNARKTGTGGGYDAKTNDVDMLVYDILGKESPVLEGLSVPESMDELAEKQFYEHNEQPSRSTISSESVIATGSGTTRKDSITQPRSKKRKIEHSVSNEAVTENADLTRRKLQLTIEVLEKER